VTDVLDRPVAAIFREPAPKARSSNAGALLATQPERWFLAAVLLGAAAIHFAMAPSHFGESTLEGVGFIASAWIQLGLAVAVIAYPARWVWRATVLTSLLLITAWAVTRTAGLPFVNAGHAESVGFVDGACVALEVIAVVVALPLLATQTWRVRSRATAFVAALGALALTTAAIASPGARDHAAHSHGLATANGATQSPVELNGQHVHGVKGQDIAAESQPDQPLDSATRAQLEKELVEARATALRYPTVADVTAAGYRLAGGFAPGSGAHYISFRSFTAPTAFALTQPLSFIYEGTSAGSRIIGLMYYAIGDRAPEGFAGPNDHWHRHSNVCIKYGANGLDVPFPVDTDVTAAQCGAAQGNLIKVTGWMVHAWVVPSWESPLGVFSHDNPNVRCADGTYNTNKAGFCRGT
jgi:hypothetical protein